METKMKKCSKCGKEVPISDFVKDAKSTDGLKSTCKRCQRRKTIIWIMVALLLTTGLGYAIFLYYNRPIESFEGAVETLETNAPDFVFNIGKATAINSTIDINGTVDNIESFKQIMERNIAEAKTNNSNNIVIPSIYTLFSFNSAILCKESRNLILEFIQAYKQTNQQAIIQVNGYTCNIGPNYANNYLSKKRANAVKNFITSNGIAEEKVETNWFGKTMNNTFNYEKNSEYRRVIIGIK